MTIAVTFKDPGVLDLMWEGGLCDDDALHSAVLLSLFSDARAPKHAGLAPEERRGFWAQPGLGSRLWLHFAQPLTAELATRIEQAALDALQWLVDDKVAKQVKVVVTRESRDRVRLAVEVQRSDAPTWRAAWEATQDGVSPCAV